MSENVDYCFRRPNDGMPDVVYVGVGFAPDEKDMVRYVPERTGSLIPREVPNGDWYEMAHGCTKVVYGCQCGFDFEKWQRDEWAYCPQCGVKVMSE